MAISDLSTVSAGRPRAFVRSRGTTSKLFSFTTRIAATAVFALGAFAAAAMLPASNAHAQVIVDICSRTAGLQDTILDAIQGDVDQSGRYTYTGIDRPAALCSDVTDAELAAITALDIGLLPIPALKNGDFAGLTNLIDLQANFTGITSVEVNTFVGLDSILSIDLSLNSLDPFPQGTLDDVLDTLTGLFGARPDARVFMDSPAIEAARNGRQTLTVRLRNDANTANVVLPQRVRLNVAATGTAAANVNLYATGTTNTITFIDIPAGEASASFDVVVGSTATTNNTATIALASPGLLPVSGGTANTRVEESRVSSGLLGFGSITVDSGLVEELEADETTSTLTVVATTPALALNGVTTTRISDESDNITVDLTMNGAVSAGSVDIAYTIDSPVSGNSVSAADFTDITNLTAPPAATVTADGSSALQFTLNVQEDNRVEGDEAGIITITSITPSGESAITPSGSNTADLEIIENDGFILTLPDVTTDDTVGDLAYVIAAAAAPVPANLAGVILDRDVSITLGTDDGTAMEPGDYTDLSLSARRAVFPANANPQTAPVHDSFTITIIDDEDTQAEAFEVSLSSWPTYLSVAKETATITINPATAPPTITPDLTRITENGGVAEVTVALSTAPSGQSVTLPFTVEGGTGTLNTDYMVTSAGCSGQCGAGGGDLVFPDGVDEQTITITAITDGGGPGDANETAVILLTAGTHNGVVVPASTSATVTIVSPTIKYVDAVGRRLEVGRTAAGSITLQIRDYLFPALPSGTNEDDVFLSVGITVNAISSIDSTNHGQAFPRASSLGGTDRNLSIEQGQAIEGDSLKIGITQPSGLTGDDRPYIINQNGSTFRLLVPKALFDNGAGRGSAVGAEDIILNITALDEETTRLGDFSFTLRFPNTLGVYTGVTFGTPATSTQTTGLVGAVSTPNRVERVRYSIVQSSAVSQLPVTLNPAAQDVIQSNTVGGAIIIALPPGVEAPAGAATAEIVLDVTSSAGADTVLSAVDRSDVTGVAVGGFTAGQFTMLVSDRRGSVFRIPDATPGTTTDADAYDDVSLSFPVSAGEPLYGNIVFQVLATAALPDTSPTLTLVATGIIFRNDTIGADGLGGVIGAETLLSGPVADRTATVTAPHEVTPNRLGSVDVSGETVPLSISGAAIGSGIVEIPYVADNVGVPVEITLLDPSDTTTSIAVGGTSTGGTGTLTAVPTPVTGTPNTVMVQGFTPGINSLTISVGATSPRVYTISVIVPTVPPDRTDSDLASATVDEVNVNLSVGTVAIDFTRTPTIVATPSVPGSAVYVCLVDNAGDFIEGDATVGVDATVSGQGSHDFIIYVVAEKAADGIMDVVRPTNCVGAQAAVDANDGTATRTDITVTVGAEPDDTANLMALSVGGTVITIPTGVGAATDFGVTLTTGTTADITARATRASTGARIAVMSVVKSTDTTDTNIAQTGTCDGSTGSITTDCGIEGVDDGETAVVTIRVTASSGTTKDYTVAVGPVSARFVPPTRTSLNLTTPNNVTTLIFQLRNYSLPSTGDFVTARIDTSGDGGGATLGLGAIGANFFESTDYTFALASGGSFEADTTDAVSNFRLRVPEALLVAGDNTDENYVNGLDIPITITAKNDPATRVGSTTFALGEVGALDSGGAATGIALNSAVHTSSVDLAVDAPTTATLSFLNAAELGTDGAILAEDGAEADGRVRSVRAKVVIANLDISVPDTKITFLMGEQLISGGASENLDPTVTGNVTGQAVAITYGTKFTVTTTDLTNDAITDDLDDSTNHGGWQIGTDYLKSNSPLEFEMVVTPGADAVAAAFYTFHIDLVSDSGIEADGVTNPTGTGGEANRGKIEIGSYESTITGEDVMDATEGGEGGSIEVTFDLGTVPGGETELFYVLTLPGATNAHALRGTDVSAGADYTIDCEATDPEGCTDHRTKDSGNEFNADRDSGTTEAADSTGRFLIDHDVFESGRTATITIEIEAHGDSVVEGTETAELTLYYPVDRDDNHVITTVISVPITDRTTSNATVSVLPTTVAEGDDATVTVTLDTGVTLAAAAEFTLLLEDAATIPVTVPVGTQAEDADFVGGLAGAANRVPILLTASSGEVPVGIVSADGVDSPEYFKLGLDLTAIVDGVATRDMSGQFTVISSGDIRISPDLAAASADARLATTGLPGLTLGGAAAPTGFLPGTDDAGAGADGGSIELPADTGSVVVVARPNNSQAEITNISGVRGACGVGTEALGVNVTSGAQLRDNGQQITAMVGGTFDAADALVTGANCISVLVTAGNGDVLTYNVDVDVLESDDTSLGTLSVGGVDAVVDPSDSTAYSVPLPGGTTAGALVIVTTDDDAEISSLQRGTGTVMLGSPEQGDNDGGAALTLIANGDTITFTVDAENGVATTNYTLTIIVQDALLSSVALTPTDEGGTEGTVASTTSLPGTGPTGSYLGSGDIPRVDADTTGGTLVITPVNMGALGATIFSVTGTNEQGEDLTVTDVGVDPTTNARTVTLGNMVPGGSELEIIVRPARATDNTNARTYTIGVVAANPNIANSASAGIESISPTTLSLGGVPPGMFNVILSGFNTINRPDHVHNPVTRYEVEYAVVRLDFGVAGGAFTGGDRTWTNSQFQVDLPAGPLDLDAEASGTSELQFQIADPSFLADGTIRYPITITPLSALEEGFMSEITITDAGGYQDDTRRSVESVATGFNPAAIIYNVVAGPAVTLDASATVTEADPTTTGTLDMVLTRNLDTLDNEPAIVTYTIGGDADRGANADYTLTVGGAAPANCNASGEGCTYRFSGSADATQTAQVVVTPDDDPVSEDDETVTILITGLSFPDLSGAQPDPSTISLPTPASVVTITDNDADADLGMFSDLTIGESGATTEATFDVALSSGPTTAVETTIRLVLSGSATYTTDYTISSSDANLAVTATPTGANVVAVVADTAFTATAPVGEVDVQFTIAAVDDSTDRGTRTVIVSLGAITPTATVFREVNSLAEAARTITINDDDVDVRGFCARTTEVRDLILAAANLVSGNNKTCLSGSEVIPTEAELAAVRTLDLSGIPSTVTILKTGDLADLTGLTSLRLWDIGPLGIIEPGALDPVLPSLTKDDGATGLTNLLDRFVSSVAVDLNHGDGNIQQGRSATIRLTRSNADVAFADANVNYTLVGAGGAATGNFELTPTPATPGTLVFADDEAVKIITITAAPGTNILGSAVFTLTGAAIALAGSADVSADIIGLGTDKVRTLQVTLPAAQPTLSLTEGSIGEKSQDELVVTLNLGTGGNMDYDDATVFFNLEMPTSEDDPIPTLALSAGPPVDPVGGDYTLDVSGNVTTGAFRATDNRMTVLRGTSTATFTFKAIDDDRREGDEVLDLEITGVNFASADADNFPGRLAAEITITEISGDDVMRETEMITHIVGKEQVNLVTGLVRQRVNALTLGTPQGFSTPGVQVSLAENPENMQDFFSQMALESSGEMDDGGAYAIWGRGQYISISGSPDIAGTDNFEYDGTIGGVGMGIERRFSETLFGLSMNFSSADIDSKSSTRAESNYKETMTFFAPYAAWKPDNSRLTLWGAAGAGFGSAEITGEGHAEGNPSVQAFFAQGGVDISDNIGKTAEVVFGLSAVAIEKTVDGFTAGTLSVPETESSVFQGQADFTAYFPVYSDDGQVLRPYVGLASVHDAGDVLNDDRHAMEVQTGIAWSNGPWQVSLDTFYQFLRDDEEAWGVFGEAHWTGRGDLDGLLMGMTSGHGTASSMSDAVSSTDSVNSDIDTNLTNADSETAEWSIQTTTEYGFAAPLLDRNGRATPFFRSTHSADARSFESGVRMDVTDNIGMTVETNRHIPADDDPYSEHAVGLEARWEF